MDRTTVTVSIPYIMRDKLMVALQGDEQLNENFTFDEEDESEEQGVKLASFDFYDINPGLLPETKLQGLGIPYKLRVHPTLNIEGETCQFRIQSDGTHVITVYQDRENARSVTLDELRQAQAGGLRAITALIEEKETAHPVLHWQDQFNILAQGMV